VLFRVSVSHLLIFLVQAYEICQPLIIHEFGGVIRERPLLDIHKVYSKSDSSVPVVFLLPSSDGLAKVSEDTSTTGSRKGCAPYSVSL